MSKQLLTGACAIVFALALAAPAAAQDNVSGLGAFEGAAGTIFKTMNSTNNHAAALYLCSDPTKTSKSTSAAVADCCIAGDIYRVTTSKGVKLFDHSANVALTPAGAAAFAPGVYSGNATVSSAQKVTVLATAGNSHPGGLAAGWTLRIITLGKGGAPSGGPVCDLRKSEGGTFQP